MHASLFLSTAILALGASASPFFHPFIGVLPPIRKELTGHMYAVDPNSGATKGCMTSTFQLTHLQNSCGIFEMAHGGEVKSTAGDCGTVTKFLSVINHDAELLVCGVGFENRESMTTQSINDSPLSSLSSSMGGANAFGMVPTLRVLTVDDQTTFTVTKSLSLGILPQQVQVGTSGMGSPFSIVFRPTENIF